MTWRHRLTICGQELVVGVLFFAAGVPLLVLSVLSVSFITVLGVGILLVPVVMYTVRAVANERRQLAKQWAGVEIPVPYRPRPARLASPGLVGAWQRCWWMLGDPATWRDLLWLLCIPVELFLGLLSGGLVVYGLEGIFVAPIIGQFISGFGYGLGWAVDVPGESWLAIPQGLLLIPLGLALAPRIRDVHARFAHALLAPTRSAGLALRVDRLTETRADAVDAQAAELRRIERDLHDGAQARLVSMGMSLGLAEKLVAEKPEAAIRLLAEARESSNQALAELRELVRGIHPPLLVEQGLAGAVQGLSLALPIPVEVDAEVPGRIPPAVESAAYFAVAEALTNVAKHSRARHAWVMVRHHDGRLLMTVADDGAGGADPERGTGLRGMERRLAAFDGTLDVASPPGGPTVVTMELPCALSSPRTMPSSGTG